MAAPKTVKTYPLTGTKDFEIPFEYLARKFVVVTLIGTDRKELILNVDYRFTQRTIITTTQTWGPGSGYTLLEIKRVTSATERLVDFSDGSILRASDLNTATVQALHIAEEGRDIATDTIGVDNDGNLDARGRRIVNLADAINPGDAVTLKQNQEWAGSALNQANRAEQQANASEASAGRSAASASAANASAVASYTDSERSIAARVQSEAARDNSQNARDQSVASAAESKQWASMPENQLVQPGLYSSYHYSRKSENSAVRSFQDADRSTTQANRATSEADRAKTEADKLGNANQFMGTIESVNGYNTIFKGYHQIKGQLYFQQVGSAVAEGKVFYMEHDTNAILYTKASNGNPLTSLTGAGHYAVTGTLTANGGSVTSSASSEGNNTHYWFEGPGGNRGVIYAGTDQILRFRAGRTTVGLSIRPDGSMEPVGPIRLPNAIIPGNADIQADWLRTGSLYGALQTVAAGTRIKNVPVVIWERGVDTVGGVGDQGAPGSQLVLRESLLPGDFYMMEVYGGAKFYSTTNCIPFGDSSTEEHNIQFDAGGSMLFRLTENGRRVTVTAGKPGNQYGIRKIWLFKLQLA